MMEMEPGADPQKSEVAETRDRDTVYFESKRKVGTNYVMQDHFSCLLDRDRAAEPAVRSRTAPRRAAGRPRPRACRGARATRGSARRGRRRGRAGPGRGATSGAGGCASGCGPNRCTRHSTAGDAGPADRGRRARPNGGQPNIRPYVAGFRIDGVHGTRQCWV